jgi:hypothetical protein
MRNAGYKTSSHTGSAGFRLLFYFVVVHGWYTATCCGLGELRPGTFGVDDPFMY